MKLSLAQSRALIAQVERFQKLTTELRANTSLLRGERWFVAAWIHKASFPEEYEARGAKRTHSYIFEGTLAALEKRGLIERKASFKAGEGLGLVRLKESACAAALPIAREVLADYIKFRNEESARKEEERKALLEARDALVAAEKKALGEVLATWTSQRECISLQGFPALVSKLRADNDGSSYKLRIEMEGLTLQQLARLVEFFRQEMPEDERSWIVGGK